MYLAVTRYRVLVCVQMFGRPANHHQPHRCFASILLLVGPRWAADCSEWLPLKAQALRPMVQFRGETWTATGIAKFPMVWYFYTTSPIHCSLSPMLKTVPHQIETPTGAARPPGCFFASGKRIPFDLETGRCRLRPGLNNESCQMQHPLRAVTAGLSNRSCSTS